MNWMHCAWILLEFLNLFFVFISFCFLEMFILTNCDSQNNENFLFLVFSVKLILIRCVSATKYGESLCDEIAFSGGYIQYYSDISKIIFNVLVVGCKHKFELFTPLHMKVYWQNEPVSQPQRSFTIIRPVYTVW